MSPKVPFTLITRFKHKTSRSIEVQFPEAISFLNNFQSLSKILRHDIGTCLDLTEKYPEDELWRRLAVRCSFSMIDSHIYNIKQFTYSVAKIINRNFTSEEMDFLREFKIKNGKEHRYTKSFKENFPRSLRLFAKLFGTEYEFPWGKEWDSFLDALNIRHRVTHPKLVENLSVSVEDLIRSNEACTWAYATLSDLLGKMHAQIIRRSNIVVKSEGNEIEHTKEQLNE